jgi:hypothetical protein
MVLRMDGRPDRSTSNAAVRDLGIDRTEARRSAQIDRMNLEAKQAVRVAIALKGALVPTRVLGRTAWLTGRELVGDPCALPALHFLVDLILSFGVAPGIGRPVYKIRRRLRGAAIFAGVTASLPVARVEGDAHVDYLRLGAHAPVDFKCSGEVASKARRLIPAASRPARRHTSSSSIRKNRSASWF